MSAWAAIQNIDARQVGSLRREVVRMRGVFIRYRKALQRERGTVARQMTAPGRRSSPLRRRHVVNVFAYKCDYILGGEDQVVEDDRAGQELR